jgi:hypothetical protein
MYCANDMWQLRVRRRRTRFMLPGFGPEGSGSDDEDWMSSGEEDGGQGGVPAGAEAPVDARALVAWNARGRDVVAGAGAGVGAAVGAGVTLGPSGRASGDGGAGNEWQAILTDMQEQLLDLKMQLSVAQQRSDASLAPSNSLPPLLVHPPYLPTSFPLFLHSLSAYCWDAGMLVSAWSVNAWRGSEMQRWPGKRHCRLHWLLSKPPARKPLRGRGKRCVGGVRVGGTRVWCVPYLVCGTR